MPAPIAQVSSRLSYSLQRWEPKFSKSCVATYVQLHIDCGMCSPEICGAERVTPLQ
jgi:hypothetical protein